MTRGSYLPGVKLPRQDIIVKIFHDKSSYMASGNMVSSRAYISSLQSTLLVPREPHRYALCMPE